MSVFEPPVIVSMVPWVGKLTGCCGGGLGSVLAWLALMLFGAGYVICGTGGDRLFAGLAKIEDNWLWHSGRIGSRSELYVVVLVYVWWKKRRIGWGVLLVVRTPLQNVVDLPRWWLWRRLSRFLAIFDAMVGFIAVIHVV
jgi:hypothetical protein